MEETKLQRLHETLKLLAPKDAVGGLGFYSGGGGARFRSAADAQPPEKKMLYSRFVEEGHFQKRTTFPQAEAPAKEKKKKKKKSDDDEKNRKETTNGHDKKRKAVDINAAFTASTAKQKKRRPLDDDVANKKDKKKKKKKSQK